MIGRRVMSIDQVARPGDYYGPSGSYTGGSQAVFFLLPGAKPGESLSHVTMPPHTFRECPDGSLAITPSILDRSGWHGYLDEGHSWREV